MQQKKLFLTDKGKLALIRIFAALLDHPVWTGLLTAAAAVLFYFFPTPWLIMSYVLALWAVHYIAVQAEAWGDREFFARLGIAVAAAASIFHALFAIAHYRDTLMMDWLLWAPLVVLVLYDWILAEPEEARPSLLERARTYLQDAHNELKYPKGD